MSYLPEGYPTFTYEEIKKLEEKIEDNIYVIWKTLIDVASKLPSDKYKDRASKITDLLFKGYLPIVPLNFNLVRTSFGNIVLVYGFTQSYNFWLEERTLTVIFLSKATFELPDPSFRNILLHELTHASGLWNEPETYDFVKTVAQRSGGKIATYLPAYNRSDYFKLPNRKSERVFVEKTTFFVDVHKDVFDQFGILPIQEIIKKKEFEEEQKEETKKEEKKLEQSSLAKFLMLSLVIFALYCIFSGGEEKK
jgi:hypothetical protein